MFIEIPTLEALIVTFIVTLVRTILEASPTILLGVAVAAFFRTQIEPESLNRLFPGEGIEGVLRTALVAVTLPVCSIGVLPLLRELHRMGLPTYKLLTLGFVAPLLNPFAIFYGLSVLSFTQFLLIIVAVVMVALAVGDVSSRFVIRSRIDSAPRPAGLTGGTRLRNLWIASSRLLTGQTLADLSMVVVVSALATSLIRSGGYYAVCEPTNTSGPLVASLLSLPQYVSPSRGVIQFAGLGNANLSLATGLTVYLCGTGLSAAMIVTLSRWYGMRRLTALAKVLFFVVLGFAYFCSYTLPLPSGEMAETGALDAMTRPSFLLLPQVSLALKESLTFLDPLMLLCAAGLLLLFVAGLIVRFADIEFRNDDPEVAEHKNAGRMSRALPASQLGAIAVAGFGFLFVLSVYVIFPGPGEFLKEMETIQLDCEIAMRSGKVEVAVDRIAAWDAAASRVSIGAAIRGSFPNRSQRQTTRDLRAELRNVRTLLIGGDLNSAREKIPELAQLLSDTSDAFAGSSS